jgi:hypothetical protein
MDLYSPLDLRSVLTIWLGFSMRVSQGLVSGPLFFSAMYELGSSSKLKSSAIKLVDYPLVLQQSTCLSAAISNYQESLNVHVVTR